MAPQLTEDCDMEYFNLDVSKIQERCEERGDIKHVRFPIRYERLVWEAWELFT